MKPMPSTATARKRTRKAVATKKPRATAKAAAAKKPRATAGAVAAKTPRGATGASAAKRPRAARKSAPAAKARRPAGSAAKVDRPAKRAVDAPRTLAEFMTRALVMETEAAQRYTEFADAMETHNNRDVAALFRKMADIEGRHAQQIMEQMGWTRMPGLRPGLLFWEGFEAPETAPGDEVHYLMQPYHALELALANEQRAERFFADLAQAATTAAVRNAALELQAEEREHVELVRAWMKKVPKPADDWANDPDPPVYTD